MTALVVPGTITIRIPGTWPRSRSRAAAKNGSVLRFQAWTRARTAESG